MTAAQHKLYVGMVRLFSLMGTGGAAWAGVRPSTTGLVAPTYANLASRTIRFLENNRVAERSSLPDIPIYTAAWWGLASADVDIAVGDIYTNGTRAFRVTGQSDTSQEGFQVIPAAVYPLIEVPGIAAQAAAGYQAGLRTGAW